MPSSQQLHKRCAIHLITQMRKPRLRRYVPDQIDKKRQNVILSYFKANAHRYDSFDNGSI